LADREIAVVAAVIERPDGSFLLAQRPEGKVYAGYWEFPGGKVEPGESPEAALRRELHEELGVEVRESFPWITRTHAYPHGTVRLDFRRVVDWGGDPHPHENQGFAWQSSGAVDVAPMLPANAPVLKALSLPTTCGITHAWETGVERALRELDLAIAGGLHLVQVREARLADPERRAFAQEVTRRMRAAGGLVLVNGDPELAAAVGADGVHLPASSLASIRNRPRFDWCGASCHSAEELRLATDLGMDFALLGPVAPTPTHPGATTLGWESFARIARGTQIPIFALGGLTRADMLAARRHGAHGLAMVRGAWMT
jgi:8-oxo-dGTP diphosphatase